ncbi:MAG: type II secretion system protein [Candidatus Sungbacteria bacterium]|nr:type II secretion system protein [bacterium]MDZ4260031.1 type II secretion system protein [Candidatus Sungbacteria bacterium]
MRYNKQRGFTLIETIVYVALLGFVSIFITDSLINITSTYQRARAQREVASNARLLLETVTKHISSAQEIYAPTSRFNNDSGQLSLVTPLDPTAEHSTAFIEFWNDAGRLLMRREGSATTTLSSATVDVTQFRVERIFQGLGREAVNITLSVSFAAIPSVASTTLNATVSLRGNY